MRSSELSDHARQRSMESVQYACLRLGNLSTTTLLNANAVTLISIDPAPMRPEVHQDTCGPDVHQDGVSHEAHHDAPRS